MAKRPPSKLYGEVCWLDVPFCAPDMSPPGGMVIVGPDGIDIEGPDIAGTDIEG